jgi:hypothetical protein
LVNRLFLSLVFQLLKLLSAMVTEEEVQSKKAAKKLAAKAEKDAKVS